MTPRTFVKFDKIIVAGSGFRSVQSHFQAIGRKATPRLIRRKMIGIASMPTIAVKWVRGQAGLRSIPVNR
jgi:hypothetical protein